MSRIILPLSLLLLASCAAKRPPVGAMGGIVVLPIQPSVFVRATFDSDASNIIGQFIPDDVEESHLDESRAARTRCSEFIKPRKIEASGEVEEVFAASLGVGGKIGVKGVAYLAGERTQTNALRIQYKAIERYVAEVDTRGLSQCCQVAPHECSSRFITSALAGDGRIYVATETANKGGVEGSGSLKGIPIAGEVMYKDGLKWERTTSFNRQYFAFTIQRTNVGKAAAEHAEDCSWARRVPKSLDGEYFVGVSEPVPSERAARDLALKDGRSQVVKFLGEWLEQSSTQSQTLSGAIGGLGGELEDASKVETFSQGIARLLKDEAWCGPEAVETPRGNLHVMRVLVFFPHSERATASRLQLTNLIETLKGKGQLTAEREERLRSAIAEIK